MARKTFSVEEFKKTMNEHLARTDSGATAKLKAGIAVALEEVLHSTGNYHGFTHLDAEDSEHGTVGYYSRYYF